MRLKTLVMAIFLTLTCPFLSKANPLCSALFFQPLRSVEFNWSENKYRLYLDRLNRNFGDNYKTCSGCVHSVERVLKNSGLTMTDIWNIEGRVLLAGEGPRTGDGLFDAFKRARDGNASDVIALDLFYNEWREDSFIKGTVTEMPFNDNSFNFIISHAVAHYLRAKNEIRDGYGLATNQQAQFISEVLRVLVSGGEARIGPFSQQESEKLTHFIGARANVTQIKTDFEYGYTLAIRKK